MAGTEKVGIIDKFMQGKDNLSLVKVDATRNELVKKRYRLDTGKLPVVYLFQQGEVKASLEDINMKKIQELVK